jgi:hypothetical protein
MHHLYQQLVILHLILAQLCNPHHQQLKKRRAGETASTTPHWPPNYSTDTSIHYWTLHPNATFNQVMPS